MIKKIIIFMSMVMLIILSGCSQESKDYSEFTMPEDYEMTTITVEQQDGIEMESHEIKHYEEFDPYQAWLEKKTKEEAQDKYNMIRDVYDNYKELEEEEDRLEDWCDSLHSNTCLRDLHYTKDHNGCREVKVECDKYDGDDICIRHDIDVKEELEDENNC